LIQLADITKTFGVRTLLEHVTWQIGDGDRVGLCGPNGAGKTTLLKMLAGFEEPDEGTVVKPAGLTIGYLPQDGLSHSGRTVFEEASSAFQPLLDMKAEMHDIEHRLGDTTVSDADHEAMLHRYSDLQDRFRLAEGYSMDLRIATVLRGLGFSTEDATRPAETCGTCPSSSTGRSPTRVSSTWPSSRPIACPGPCGDRPRPRTRCRRHWATTRA